MTTTPSAPTPLPRELPFVGRTDELEELGTVLGAPGAVESMRMLTGETGVGKSRLSAALVGEARQRGWTVLQGRAYPVETGIPYAVFSDAFLPLLRSMGADQLTVLTRGNRSDLQRLFPPLGEAAADPESGADPGERRARLYWSFAEFLKRLAGEGHILLVLEDLHWAAPSTLGLLHFLARHLDASPVRLVGTYNTDYRNRNEALVKLERSLLSLRTLRLHHIRPLTATDTTELLERTFGVRSEAVGEFSRVLYGWTKGNPYFIEQTLQRLVRSGRLYERGGIWLGWEAEEFELSPSVQEAVAARFDGTGEDGIALAETLATAGGRSLVSVLVRGSGMAAERVDAATESLVGLGLIEESDEGSGEVSVEFRHPLVRETLYQRLSLSRRARLHGRVAHALELQYAAEPEAHADELAYHFVRSGESGDGARATRYLVAAGQAALRRHADREAATYLEEAMARATPMRERPPSPSEPVSVLALRRDLARAKARLGRYGEAERLWRALLAEAQSRQDPIAIAEAYRHLSLLAFWSGRYGEALELHEEAVEAVTGKEPALEARLHLTAGVVFNHLGHAGEARERLQRALPLAEDAKNGPLMARIHRALSLVHTWVGEPELARSHATRSIKLAEDHGDHTTRFWGQWTLAALEGILGHTREMRSLMESLRTTAEDLGSPVLRLWVHELGIQYLWAVGDWDTALAEGEAAIALARALNQKALLTRLLVWTALLYLGRGDLARGRALCEEAADLAGLQRSDDGGLEPLPADVQVPVHAVIPAHIGFASLAVAEGDMERAVEVGERGLAIADRHGYVTWALHLLPPVLEAYVRSHRLEDALREGRRMRAAAERIGHPLASAWAQTCDALVDWFSDRIPEAVESLRQAAEALERIPIVPEAARIRRQLAGRLADLGMKEEALRELRRVHETFGQLGATPELEKTREMFRELDSRPPARAAAEGTAELTGREVEIARLVARRASNKAIAKELGIAPRTVTTHLSNMYRKLGVGSRHELADLVREARIPMPD